MISVNSLSFNLLTFPFGLLHSLDLIVIVTDLNFKLYLPPDLLVLLSLSWERPSVPYDLRNSKTLLP